MISILGRFLVLAALLFAASGTVTGLVAGARRSGEGRWWTERFAYAFAGTMIAANLLMVYALLARDFSVGYVAQVGSTQVPDYIAAISLWSSLEGSILFWGAVLGLYVAGFTWAHRGRHPEYMSWALGILLAISVFFSFLVASIANPFAPVAPVPLEGPGPNPLLQNHILMAVHPPMLYLGYVGMSVPFAIAAAALLAGRLEAGWVTPLRRWTLLPWTFLTLGIVLGGWWSYEVLGWGGYWAWDPVENASFHPWLTATAFLHSAMVVQRRGALKTWSLVLVMSTFLLTLLGTFMTRSGVFNSVHSFTQSEIGPVFLAFIAVCTLFSIGLLAVRSDRLEAPPKPDDPPPGVAQALLGRSWHFGPTGREFAMLVQNVLFTVWTFVVLLGTLYPLIVEATQGRQLLVGEPYFDRWTLPVGLAIVFMMGVGPALPWGRIERGSALVRLGLPVGFGLVAALVGVATGIDRPYILLALFVCGFSTWANVAEVVQPAVQRARSTSDGLAAAMGTVLRKGRRKVGGLVAHLGVIVMVVALALSKGYRVERDFTLSRGEAATIGAYTATYTGARMEKEAHRDALVATFSMRRDDRALPVQEPRLNYYDNRRDPIGTPAVYTTPSRDVYLSLVQVAPDGAWASVRIAVMPAVVWLWIGTGIVTIGALLALWPAARRRTAPVPAATPAAIVEGRPT